MKVTITKDTKVAVDEQQAKQATILSMYKKNLSIELIAECTRTTVEEVNKIITNNK